MNEKDTGCRKKGSNERGKGIPGTMVKEYEALYQLQKEPGSDWVLS